MPTLNKIRHILHQQEVIIPHHRNLYSTYNCDGYQHLYLSTLLTFLKTLKQELKSSRQHCFKKTVQHPITKYFFQILIMEERLVTTG